MARIRYADTSGSPFNRLIDHAPEIAESYRALRRAMDAGALPPRLRMLAFLASDVQNQCHY